jgi:hypothetical protein
MFRITVALDLAGRIANPASVWRLPKKGRRQLSGDPACRLLRERSKA